MTKLKKRAPLVNRRLGQTGTVLFTGLCSGEVLSEWDGGGLVEELFDSPLAVAYLAAALVFLASSRLAILRSAQPILLLALSPVQALGGAGVLGALAFALAGALLSMRMGFFKARAASKAVFLCFVVAAAESGSVLLAPEPRAVAGPALSCAIVFGVFAFALARRKILTAFAPKREVLSLQAFSLTRRERQFVLGLLAGKSTKQIGFEYRLSDSTVRCTLAHAYRKLGVRNSSELAAMGERYSFE
ncbi:MAG TPA: helix-turn-helix transcriptional regulator [Rectinemataceae bacterium]|nr:helix-turn-helix transcriptional regulator [Rectinemataceae bacterium]